jgi:anti-sigma factor RsiW
MAVNENQERLLLLRSFDEALNAEEQAVLNAALARSERLREEQRQLEEMRSLLTELQAPPAPDFTEGVIANLRVRQEETRLAGWVVRLAAACLLLFTLGLLSLYWQEGALNVDVILGLENLAPDDAYSLLDY